MVQNPNGYSYLHLKENRTGLQTLLNHTNSKKEKVLQMTFQVKNKNNKFDNVKAMNVNNKKPLS